MAAEKKDICICIILSPLMLVEKCLKQVFDKQNNKTRYSTLSKNIELESVRSTRASFSYSHAENKVVVAL